MANKLLTRPYIIIHTILALIVAGLFLTARLVSGFGEWYATHIYPIFVYTIGRLCGIFPFSVGEIALYALVLVIVIYLICTIVKLLRRRLSLLAALGSLFRKVVSLTLILLTLYMLTCGVNYYRDSFSHKSGIEADQYTVQQLADLFGYVATQLNEVGDQVATDGDGLMLLTDDCSQAAVTAMKKLGTAYSDLSGYYPQPKLLLFSTLLSVQQVTGIYSPFTVEANVNSDMVPYNIPFTMCHELSHLKGFMSENEANFIAFLACYYSDSWEFRYSGLMMAYIYSGNALYKVDYDSWYQVRSTVSSNVLADLQANTEFWAQYEGTISELQTSVNDSYLKINGQEDGVSSYGQVLDLMLAWYTQLADY